VDQGSGRFVADAAIGAGHDGDPAALGGHFFNCPMVAVCHFMPLKDSY
jgi:hypothetical protein